MKERTTENKKQRLATVAADNIKVTVGWQEWLALPELGISRIKVKIDTGARTSALHAENVETFFDEAGCRQVRFHVESNSLQPKSPLICTAAVIDYRRITSSNGQRSKRYVIHTLLRLNADLQWPIEVTLADRGTMLFPMLLGRTAMSGRILVDPQHGFLLGR